MTKDLDASRKKDLEELTEGIRNADSAALREYLEQMAYRIVNESTDVRSLREDLIKAVRSGDARAVERIQLHLQYIRGEETRGESWGANKGNRKAGT